MENDFETKSKVTPIASSDSLAQRFGDGEKVKIIVKIPLTEDSIGYYDVDDVLGNRNLDARYKGFFRQWYDAIKLRVFNWLVNFGVANKMKFSSVFEFPQISSKFIKSAKFKKAFFTTEDCRPEEENCNDRGSLGSNFNLVDTLFVNVSAQKKQGPVESTVEQLEYDEWITALEHSTQQSLEVREDLMSKNITLSEAPKKREINLVTFINNRPYINLDSLVIKRSSTRKVNLGITNNEKEIASYLRSQKFSHLINRIEYGDRPGRPHTQMRRKIKGMNLYLKDGVRIEQVLEIIKSEQSSFSKKMFILRLDGRYIETKKYFEADRFRAIIKDMTMIGRSLYVEVSSDEQIKPFEQILRDEKEKIDHELMVYKLDRCIRKNCVELNANDVNLVPLLENGNDIKLDTYISVQKLGTYDFKYNGFIEVEIELELPL